MSCTAQLLQQTPNTVLLEFAKQIEGHKKEKFKVVDLFKQIARETFNGTQPVLSVANESVFKKSLKLAIATKYTQPKDVSTLGELLQNSSECYMNKLHDKLIRAARSIGTHVHKTTSTCIEDSANYFVKPIAIKTGVNSATLASGRHVTGSKDGTLVAAFGLLSATYRIANGEALSIFERLAMKDPITLKTFAELGAEQDYINELSCTALRHKEMPPSNKISQFHKQNFIEFAGKRITITPLQSVNTTVALKQSIDRIFQEKGRINVKRYIAGGAQSQNVSSLNQDLGGSIPHLKAWIPSQNKQQNVFYFLYRTQRLSLNHSQKQLISTLAWSIKRIEDKGFSNQSDRNIVDNTIIKIVMLQLLELEEFAFKINELKDQNKLINISKKINNSIKEYFTADSIATKTAASEILALELIAKIAAEMKRNKLNVHIEAKALNEAAKILQKGEVLCPLH